MGDDQQDDKRTSMDFTTSLTSTNTTTITNTNSNTIKAEPQQQIQENVPSSPMIQRQPPPQQSPSIYTNNNNRDIGQPLPPPRPNLMIGILSMNTPSPSKKNLWNKNKNQQQQTIVKKEEEEDEVRVAAGQKWQQEPKQSRIRLGSEDLLLNHAQLSSYKKGKKSNMTPERILMLEEVGFEWDVYPKREE